MQETRLLELSRQNRWKEVMFVLQEKGGLQFSSVHIARQVAKSFSRVGRGEDVEAILSFAPAEENAYLDVGAIPPSLCFVCGVGLIPIGGRCCLKPM